MRITLLCYFLLFMVQQQAGGTELGRPGYDENDLADAIFLAEGGAKTRHPYGILKKYKHTTPRQACINTIRHARRDWDGQGDFIDFLAGRYAPIGADNDPKNLNKNWARNVRAILERRKI